MNTIAAEGTGSKVRHDDGHEPAGSKVPRTWFRIRPNETDDEVLARVARYRRLAAEPGNRQLLLLVGIMDVARDVIEEWLNTHSGDCLCPTCTSQLTSEVRRDLIGSSWALDNAAGQVRCQTYGSDVKITTVPVTLKKLARSAARLERHGRRLHRRERDPAAHLVVDAGGVAVPDAAVESAVVMAAGG